MTIEYSALTSLSAYCIASGW